MLLAIDTATNTIGLALHDGDNLIADQLWRTGKKHNTLLAPSVQHLLTVCSVAPTDLTAVAVAHGPGSYTGLRIGVALAKGIAGAHNLPLIGVSTLDVIAAGQRFQNTRHKLLTVIAAGRGRIVAGVYRVRKGRWVADDDPQITTWEALLDDLDGSFYVAGEIDAKGREALAAARGDDLNLTLVDPAERVRRAGFLAEEAWRRYRQGDPADFRAVRLAPIYINEPG